MFEQIREQRLVAHVSGLVFAELEDTPLSSSRDALLGIVRELHRLPEPDRAEVDALVDTYMAKKAFPEDKRDDAIHVALAVLSPSLDAMVSWNCRHLANAHNRRRLKVLTLAEGYSFNIDIVTPEEVLIYGQTG